MSGSDVRSTTVAALRRDFDESFAAPARVGSEDIEDLLALRVGGDAYAARLSDINGLLLERAPTPVPTAVPEFLGVVGLRGALVPVWSLGALLGYGADPKPPRWMILAGGKESRRAFGLAFEHFEGHIRAPRGSFSELASGDAERPERPARTHVRQSVHLDGRWRGVLALDALADEVDRRIGFEAAGDRIETR